MTPRPRHTTGKRAMTLLELLVTSAITVLMLVLLAQISGNTLQTTRISRQRLESIQHVREILDALDVDLSNLVAENGLTVLVATDASNNTQLSFLARGRGPDVSGSDSSRLLALSYQLTGNEVQRKLSPVAWDNLDLVGAITSATTSSIASNFGKGILRFEACAVLSSGSSIPLSETGPWKISTINGQTLASPYSALVLKNPLVSSTTLHVRAITVTVAALDEQSLNLPNAKSIAAALPSAAPGMSPLETWNAAILSGSLSNYPRPAVAALHLDQRTYQLK